MKTIIGILLLSLLHAVAQTPSYYRDSRLDSINGGVNLVYHVLDDMQTNMLNPDNVDKLGMSYKKNLIEYKLTNNSFAAGVPGQNVTGTASNMSSVMGAFMTNQVHDAGSDYGYVLTNYPSGVAGYDNSTANSQGISSLINFGTYGAGYGMPNTLDLRFVSQTAFFKNLASTIRQVLLACVYGFLWYLTYQDIIRISGKVFDQRQIQGSLQSLWGFNSSAVIGGIYAAVVASAFYLGIHSLFSGTFITTAYAKLPTIYNYLANAPTTVPGYDVITAFVPFFEIVIAYLSYWTFYIFLVVPAGLGLRVLLWALPV
jgi:hypothetical protein